MLAECWPWVKERLQRIKEKDRSAGHWLPEHVRHRVLQGLFGQSMVELYLAVDDDQVLYGFIVTDTLVDPFVNVPLTLWVWAGWGNRAMIRLLPWLVDLAKKRGLTGIEFDSGRVGWARTILSERMSFTLKKMVYRMELE
jgi:hypothetical protein